METRVDHCKHDHALDSEVTDSMLSGTIALWSRCLYLVVVVVLQPSPKTSLPFPFRPGVSLLPRPAMGMRYLYCPALLVP